MFLELTNCRLIALFISFSDTSNSNSSAVLRTFAVNQTKNVIKNNYPRTLSKSNNKSEKEINTTSRALQRFEPCNTTVEKLPILKEKQEENLIRDQTDNGKHKEHKKKEQPNVDTIEDVTDPSIVKNIAQYLTGDEVIDQEIIKFYARRGIVVNTGSF